MNKILILYGFMMSFFIVRCQNSNSIYCSFQQKQDSIFYLIYDVYLMSSDSMSFTQNIFKTSIENNRERIYFKNKLLYEYEVNANVRNGYGEIYYPFLGITAIQGVFKDNKRNGIFVITGKSGKIETILLYKEDRFIRFLSLGLSKSEKKELKIKSKHYRKLKIDPLNSNELIIKF